MNPFSPYYVDHVMYAIIYIYMQMGSELKSSAAEEQIMNVMKKWHADVRKRRQQSQQHQQECCSSQRKIQEKPHQVELNLALVSSTVEIEELPHHKTTHTSCN